jgi:hypothetical protein
MKQILTVLIIFLGITSSNAQFDKNNFIYSTGELNLGNYIGLDLNVNYVLKKKYAIKLGYTGNIRKPKSQPDNYSSGLKGLLLLGLSNPYDHFINYHISFGKLYKLNKSGTIRANLLLGLGYTTIKEPENWKFIDKAFFTENYDWNYKKHNTISVIINPTIEFPISRFYGFTISPTLQFNKYRTYFGIGIGQMIGILKEKKD